MTNNCKRKLKFTSVFTALLLGISNVHAQRADAVPIIKYAVNNFATISKACDTCLKYAGKPLIKGRPIPPPEVS
ncbi:MAG TPA: hypothetical protein VLJ41_02630, partial [Segetibacter sp.]|nr:hypothetical protein [Segetibacter sp.]